MNEIYVNFKTSRTSLLRLKVPFPLNENFVHVYSEEYHFQFKRIPTIASQRKIVSVGKAPGF